MYIKLYLNDLNFNNLNYFGLLSLINRKRGCARNIRLSLRLLERSIEFQAQSHV